jgi:hypothetical protein
MTLLYGLFGIPRNLDEVLDKSEKKKLIPNVVIKRRYIPHNIPGTSGFKYRIGVEVGLTKLNLFESKDIWINNYIPEIDGASCFQDIPYREMACEIADKLSSKGFTVKLNNEFYNLDDKVVSIAKVVSEE